ncbi:hypothetical protein B296_00022332 [Ensete ventricosum]|uniref:Uncharacterized protein n=1 Tax=Ensete ventricosum TaxID=4639 RepID=A0A426YRJ2_ENSVE|nr:hypothetical protein B296_00022332 [Ensete ventricosum]
MLRESASLKGSFMYKNALLFELHVEYTAERHLNEKLFIGLKHVVSVRLGHVEWMLFSSRLRDMPWRLCHRSYKSKSLSSYAMTSSAKGMLLANATTTVNKKALAVVNAYVLWTEEKPSTGWSYDKGSEPCR